VIRKLAWKRTPTTLRTDLSADARRELYAELDLATWEELQERCGAITPLQTLFLGLDNRLADIPGAIGNRLRQQRLLEPPRRDLEIEIDPRPSATTPAGFPRRARAAGSAARAAVLRRVGLPAFLPGQLADLWIANITRAFPAERR
jgi:hypothetical protein